MESTKRNDGGPAYPTFRIAEGENEERVVTIEGGMTLRDCMVIAMAPAICQALMDRRREDGNLVGRAREAIDLAVSAADYWLAERERQKGNHNA